VNTAVPSADTIIRFRDVIGASGPEVIDTYRRVGCCAVVRHRSASACRRSAGHDRAWQDRDWKRPTTAQWCCGTTAEVPIAVVRGEDRNMKVTEPVDVFLDDRLVPA